MSRPNKCSQTAVVFAVGRVAARAVVTRADRADALADADRLAAVLAERIRAVARGDIPAEPVPLADRP